MKVVVDTDLLESLIIDVLTSNGIYDNTAEVISEMIIDDIDKAISL